MLQLIDKFVLWIVGWNSRFSDWVESLFEFCWEDNGWKQVWPLLLVVIAVIFDIFCLLTLLPLRLWYSSRKLELDHSNEPWAPMSWDERMRLWAAEDAEMARDRQPRSANLEFSFSWEEEGF